VAERTFALQHIKVSLPVHHSQMQFSVQSHEQQSLVTLRWELNFLDSAMEAQMKPMIDGAAQMTLTQLKALVEKEQ
jgi:phenylpropionate dioxygenase-like ring-hydroxylating dioxygenase large terminal subunit